MRGFVVAVGHSGTTWTARALTACTDLDARHESMGHHLGAGFDGVEVNGNLWNEIRAIRERFLGAPIIHQVRDGRDVVRTLMSKPHKPGWTFRDACERWARWNGAMLDATDGRVMLEDITTDASAFIGLAEAFDATSVHIPAWEMVRDNRVNATRHTFPVYPGWNGEEVRTFWTICGPMMEALGYR